MVALHSHHGADGQRLRVPCQFEWPADCFTQCGDRGVVFITGTVDRYSTAFFEAFPRNPDTFIRGEGVDIAAAEADAWHQWQRILACAEHSYDRKGYTNGGGICVHCGLFKMGAFPQEDS